MPELALYTFGFPIITISYVNAYKCLVEGVCLLLQKLAFDVIYTRLTKV